MRTTVNLPDDLLREAKAFAARERMTLGRVLEEGLRRMLDGGTAKRRIKLPTSSARIRPGIDINNNAEILRIMDELD